MMQHTVQSVPAVAHGCDITDSGICVTVNENAGCAVRLAVYDKSGKVIAVSSATSRGVLAADMPEELRNEKLAGWKRAVRCALAWAEE